MLNYFFFSYHFYFDIIYFIGCSPALHPFEFDEEAPKDQEFAVLSFMNPSFSCTKWSYKLKQSVSFCHIFIIICCRYYLSGCLPHDIWFQFEYFVLTLINQYCFLQDHTVFLL